MSLHSAADILNSSLSQPECRLCQNQPSWDECAGHMVLAKTVSQHTFLNKTCQREKNLLPLQRLLTTMRLTTIRYSSFIDLNFISFRQFSVWTVIQRFAAEPLQLITLCEKAFDGVRPETVWLFDFVKAFDPKPPFSIHHL